MANKPDLRAKCAAYLREHAEKVPDLTAFVGLDGFVDDIVHVVDQRQDAENYTRLNTITDMANRIGQAAGVSTNIELVSQRTKIGGNGPIMANALAGFGIHLTYLGTLGYPNLHPVFEEFGKRTEVHSINIPGHTNAIEFHDGKIMASLLTPLSEVTWELICERFGKQQFAAKIMGSSLVGFVNWTMIPYMSQIWEKVLSEICQGKPATRRKIFFDLADPEKRTPEDIRHALDLIGQFGAYFDVILGLNEKEAGEIGEVFGLERTDDSPESLTQLIHGITEQISVDTLVVHPVRYALASDGTDVASVTGPFIQKPVITTGAGDHFNAGFCLGQLLGLDREHSLLCGVSTSGFYVRNGHGPSVEDLAGFMLDWPESPAE
jgi:fructose-1-phosphate kinase PfkB-like protein